MTDKEKQTILFVKERGANTVVLFERGDYYEMYEEDAEIFEKIFNIYRVDNYGNKIEGVNGFPHYNLDTCIKRLALNGYGVAIVNEQGYKEKKKYSSIMENCTVYALCKEEYEAIRHILEAYKIMGKISYEDKGYDSEIDAYEVSFLADPDTREMIWSVQHHLES